MVLMLSGWWCLSPVSPLQQKGSMVMDIFNNSLHFALSALGEQSVYRGEMNASNPVCSLYITLEGLSLSLNLVFPNHTMVPVVRMWWSVSVTVSILVLLTHRSYTLSVRVYSAIFAVQFSYGSWVEPVLSLLSLLDCCGGSDSMYPGTWKQGPFPHNPPQCIVDHGLHCSSGSLSSFVFEKFRTRLFCRLSHPLLR